MDNFRLILLVIGALVVAGVYFASRNRVNRKGTRQSNMRRGIRLGSDKQANSFDVMDLTANEHLRAPYKKTFDGLDSSSKRRRAKLVKAGKFQKASLTGSATIPLSIEPLNVVVVIMAVHGTQFRKDQVLHALKSIGCAAGRGDKYCFFIQGESTENRRELLFTISDIQSPSIFLMDQSPMSATDGFSLELELPLSIDSMAAFEKMLTMAKVLAAKINGVVCDDLQNRLTKQATIHIQDKIMDFQRRLAFTQSLTIQQ